MLLYAQNFAERKREKAMIPAPRSNRVSVAYASSAAKSAHRRKALGEGVMLKICPSIERFKIRG